MGYQKIKAQATNRTEAVRGTVRPVARKIPLRGREALRVLWPLCREYLWRPRVVQPWSLGGASSANARSSRILQGLPMPSGHLGSSPAGGIDFAPAVPIRAGPFIQAVLS